MVALTIVWVAWAGWSLLGRSSPYELRVLDDLGAPIAAAIVDIDGSQVGTSNDNGRVEMEWNRTATVLEVSAPGHVPQMLTVGEPPGGVLDVVLKARVLRGRVIDPDGVAVESAVVISAGSTTVTDREGLFTLRGAEPGEIQVAKPAWIAETFVWEGGQGEASFELAPFVARAVHVSGEAVRDRLPEFIQMAMDTELNALMIDLKNEAGCVFYGTANPVALDVGAVCSGYDLASVVGEAHDVGLYVIGRLVVFSDPIAARARPEMAVWDSATNSAYSANGQFFLDPTDPDARQYGLDLAVEACAGGVDEIQFDYVRFPDARSESAVFDQGVGDEVRLSTIIAFLNDAVNLLHPLGCAVAADVFGFLTTHNGDGGIGQRWEDVAMVVDVISPMLYPSHYSTDWFGFETPNDHPGSVVREALTDGFDRLPRNVVVRPWLQDFGYDASQVRAEIQSAESFGLGWMLWNALSNVTIEALDGPG